MMEFYELHSLPILFTGPHSYAASPIETFFAHFKSVHFNVTNLATGKRNFGNILKLVVKRIQEMPVHHRPLWWHHCLQHLFGYLVFARL